LPGKDPIQINCRTVKKNVALTLKGTAAVPCVTSADSLIPNFTKTGQEVRKVLVEIHLHP